MSRRLGKILTFAASGAVVAVCLGLLFGTEAGSAARAAAAAGTPPDNTAAPTISGTALVGQTLTASPGSWSGSSPITYSFYAWRRCDSSGANCTVVSNRSSQTYTLTSSDVGKTMRVGVTATNSAGSGWALSAATAIVASTSPPSNTAAPTISGTTQDGQTLTASPGSWSGSSPITYSFYAWRRCDSSGGNCTLVSNKSSQTYTLTSSDVGKTMRVGVTATNSAGSGWVLSAATAIVASASPPPAPPSAVAPSNTAAPTISGTAQADNTLSANVGSWSGTTPMTYAYQWQRCDSGGANCTVILGAAGQAYTLGSSDVGMTVDVSVTATNSAGSSSALSAGTAVVQSASPVQGSSIYWGAAMDGSTVYGSGYGDPPWDTKTWNLFESHAGKKVSVVHWGVLTPWSHDFNYFKSMFERVRSAGDLSVVDMSTSTVPLRDIASGAYDSSLRTWVQQAKAWGYPFFLRFDWEMNGRWFPWGTTPTNQNTPSDFVNAWRHFYNLAASVGASNITWVWCPNEVSSTETPLSQVYPGDAYVDWTCIEVYNWGPSNWWRSFSTVLTESYNQLLQLAPSKPIMIGEMGSAENGGSKANWITDALTTQLPQNFKQIKAILWFNEKYSKNGITYPFQIESSSSAQTAFANGIKSSYYKAGGSFANLPLLSKIKPL